MPRNGASLALRARGVHKCIAALMLVVAACDTTSPARPVEIVLTGGTAFAGTVGRTVTPDPRIEIRDATGHAIGGVLFTVRVVEGAGTLTGTPAKTATGPTSIGLWTLGPVVGVNSLSVESPGLTPVVLTLTSSAGPPAIVTPIGPTGGNGFLSNVAPLVPAVRVTDAFGNAIDGVHVSAAAGPQGGIISVPNSVTDVTGSASAGTWTLGNAKGVQTVTMTVLTFAPVVFTVTASAAFHIEVRFTGALPSAAIQSAFQSAADRLERVIIGHVPAFTLTNYNAATQCGEPTLPVLNEIVDDLLIMAQVTAIDGVGGILGQAGPCDIRDQSFLPYIGIMQFDVADVNTLVTQGRFGAVVLHEMVHILGFGTIWEPPQFTLLSGVGTSNPIFVGPAARPEYVATGGTSAAGVPVEAGGGAGTALAHWRESVFRDELMTGVLTGGTQPFSRMSIASLADLGYTVSFATADSYVVLPPGQARSGNSVGGSVEAWERLIVPKARRGVQAPPGMVFRGEMARSAAVVARGAEVRGKGRRED